MQARQSPDRFLEASPLSVEGHIATIANALEDVLPCIHGCVRKAIAKLGGGVPRFGGAAFGEDVHAMVPRNPNK